MVAIAPIVGSNLSRDSLWAKDFSPLPIESWLQSIRQGNHCLKMSRFWLLPPIVVAKVVKDRR